MTSHAATTGAGEARVVQAWAVTKIRANGKQQKRTIKIDEPQRKLINLDGSKMKKEFFFAECSCVEVQNVTECLVSFDSLRITHPYHLAFRSAEDANAFYTLLNKGISSVTGEERLEKHKLVSASIHSGNKRIVSTLNAVSARIRSLGWAGTIKVTGTFPALSLWISATVSQDQAEGDVQIDAPITMSSESSKLPPQGGDDSSSSDSDSDSSDSDSDSSKKKKKKKKETQAGNADGGSTSKQLPAQSTEGQVGSSAEQPIVEDDNAGPKKNKAFAQRTESAMNSLQNRVKGLALSMHSAGITGAVGCSTGFEIGMFGINFGITIEVELSLTSVVTSIETPPHPPTTGTD